MLSDTFPDPGQFLCRDITRGAPIGKMSKLSLFSPGAIEETGFANGRHRAQPTGRVLLPAEDELLLLHFKYLGLEETQRRHEAYRLRLRSVDIARGWGHKYLWSRQQLEQDWRDLDRRAVDVSAPGLDLAGLHPDRWWSHLPRAAQRSGSRAG